MEENKEMILRELFNDGAWQDDCGEISYNNDDVMPYYAYNATSEKQLLKLRAINEMLNVQKYLEKGWKPDWHDQHQSKYYIALNARKQTLEIRTIGMTESVAYFSSLANVKKAIDILGEETIKLALCTDW